MLQLEVEGSHVMSVAMSMAMLIRNDWRWMLCKLLNIIMSAMIMMRNHEIVNMAIMHVNLHGFLCRRDYSVMIVHVAYLVMVRLIEVGVVDQVAIVMQLGWKALTVEKSELMILNLNFWWPLRSILIVLTVVLTVKRAQLTRCIVRDLTDLVTNLVVLVRFRVLRVFDAFSRISGHLFPAFSGLIRLVLLGIVAKIGILNANLHDFFSLLLITVISEISPHRSDCIISVAAG